MAEDALYNAARHVLPDTVAADWMPLDRPAFLHWLVCAGRSRGDVLPAYARDPVSLTSTGIHTCRLASARGCTLVAFSGRGSHSAAAAQMALDVLQRNPFGLPCPQTPVVCIALDGATLAQVVATQKHAARLGMHAETRGGPCCIIIACQ